MQPERIVVVGGGLAGLRTLEELRARGYPGGLTLIGAESRAPYDRPPLSKQVMTGAMDDTTLRGELDSLGADVRLSESAVALAGPVVRTSRDEYEFDRLVIATGARPVSLPGPGPQRLLRTLDDALSLRSALVPGRSLAIVGAGWIGAELATAAVARGCQVTVVEAGPAPLAGAVGDQVGATTAEWYERAGVDLRLGQAVESIQTGGLALAGGGWLAADEIVTAVGVRPEVGWLESSGIIVENGVAVDGALCSSLPGVYAAGDCAAFWSARFGRRMRTEHWDVALRAPAVVAANLLGGTERFDPVPYFWSEQFGRMLQYVGDHRGAGEMIWRGTGDPVVPPGPVGPWGACWLAAGRLVALLAVDRPRDVQQGRRLIEAGSQVDPALIADAAVSVRDAAVG